MKLCTKCKTEKPVEAFYKDKCRKDGLRAECKVCVSVILKAWYEANKERVAAERKAWYEANKERAVASQKAYREANPDKVAARSKAWREANPDKIAAQQKAYREVNLDKIAAATRRRQAAKLQRTPPWLTRDHNHQMIQMYAERDRLTKETGVQYHVDHIVPLRGKNISGLHVPWNLQVITAHENQTKNNRWSEA